MKRLIAVIAILSLCVIPLVAQEKGADSRPTSTKGRKMGLARPLVFEGGKEVYGANLAGIQYVGLKTAIKDAKIWDGKKVQLRGKITAVCSKKGCWMKVKQDGQEIRVKFTGYSFFVPLDAAGRDVAVEGTLSVRVEKEAERRHYAEDAGASKADIAKIKGDKSTVSFMADAVQIGKLPPLKKKGGCEGCEGCEMKKTGATSTPDSKSCGGCEKKAKQGSGSQQ